MSESIHCPAAWRGPELFERQDWTHTLSESDWGEIEAAWCAVSATQMPLEAIGSGDFVLPKLGGRLRQIQHDLEHGSGAVLLRGFPTERCSAQDAAKMFWGLVSHLGTPVSQTATGERIFHVRDEGLPESHPQARGPSSRNRLSFHTDRCDVIAFLCLKQAKSGGDNLVVSSVTLYNELLHRRPDLLEVLLQPYYYQRHNVDSGNQLPYYRQPVFSIYQGHFAASLLRVLIERAYLMPELPRMTDQQREALDELDSLAEDPLLHVNFRQQPGDVVMLNNWVTFHRRTAFEDHPERERRRHLLRIWLAVPNSRPLAPDFSASYGSTQAGAVRGGMRVKRSGGTR